MFFHGFYKLSALKNTNSTFLSWRKYINIFKRLREYASKNYKTANYYFWRFLLFLWNVGGAMVWLKYFLVQH